jgi:2-dehydropantoate 2-reductase
MRIVVIGAGAMGSLFAGYLSARPEHDVWLLGSWQPHIEALQRIGLRLISPERQVRFVPVKAVLTIEQLPAPFELAIVFVKSHATARAATQAARLLAPDGLALTMQNGLGNRETLAAVLGEARVVQGVTSHGATLVGAGAVRHAGVGPTHLAPGASDPAAVVRLAEALTLAGFPTEVEGDVASLLWGKLVVNAGINALTALLRVPNGALADVPEAEKLMAQAVAEAAEVARAAGIPLPYPDPLARVMAVAHATASNRSSMLADVLRGVHSEVEVINGAIVREAARLGVPVPVNTMLTALMRALDATIKQRVLDE